MVTDVVECRQIGDDYEHGHETISWIFSILIYYDLRITL